MVGGTFVDGVTDSVEGVESASMEEKGEQMTIYEGALSNLEPLPKSQ